MVLTASGLFPQGGVDNDDEDFLSLYITISLLENHQTVTVSPPLPRSLGQHYKVGTKRTTLGGGRTSA